MPEVLVKEENKLNTKRAIFSTLAFFGLYEIPISFNRLYQLLFKIRIPPEPLEEVLEELVRAQKIYSKENLFSLKNWDWHKKMRNQEEIAKRWQKINRYVWLLRLVPFIEQVSVINSVAMGNADTESDIDFFVITKPNRLYFVRTLVILLFRTLKIYKTRQKMNNQFCFGFYVTLDNLSIQELLLPGEDPYLAFWLATILPIVGQNPYKDLITANNWIYEYFPNLDITENLKFYTESSNGVQLAKKILEVILFLPVLVLEPLLRFIHIRHTFNLPENHWPTSSTVANRNMLKLHALDPRKEIRDEFNRLLQSLS